ncbi:MAG TPA: PBP1A family penicillin-binding protein [Thermoanaerobaculia bacterium]|nr:PBP1A family penicillin-binding protein [Thermoanaerobaculia bacterium]
MEPVEKTDSRRRRWIRRPRGRMLSVLVLVFALGAFLGLAGWWTCGFRGCPNVDTLSSYTPEGAPVLLDRNGEPFAELKPAGHQVVELESLPEYVPEAFIAVEDRRFREHDGVDWRRVAGALLANVRAGDIEEGSSTITMQLAGNVFPDRISRQRRTLGRKLLEARVSRKIESEFSKDEILELYLNYIYFGGGARGIAAASRLYFNKSPEELTLEEAALLAALPKAPTYYDPRRHPERAEERRNLVLDLMEQQGRLEAGEAEAARQASIDVDPGRAVPRDEQMFAPYFVEQVRQELEREFGDAIYTEPLQIRTTLDVGAQRAAEEELARQLAAIEGGNWGRFRGPRYAASDAPPAEATEYLQGAVVVLDAENGDVLAWVGGRDFYQSRFDRVEDARRQVGSAFKPFVYATALAQGHVLSEPLSDQPLELALDRRRTWRPKNFTGEFEGQVAMRDALVRSKNVPTARLAQEVGTTAVAATARQVGLPDDRIPRTPAMALGTAALSPLELATAYTTFANLGVVVEPRRVLEVTREDGEVVWSSEVERRQVMDPGVAFLITDVLQDVVRRGTGTAVRQAGFRAAAAGKTGTTNDRFDTWFVGFTPEMVGAVWIGFDQPRSIVPAATGGRLAAPVWGRMMRRVYNGRPDPGGWQPPGDVARRTIDPATGLLIAEGCQPGPSGSRPEYFLLGTEPQAVCPSAAQVAGVEPGDEDWRTLFRDWLDSWGGEDDATGEGMAEIPEGGLTVDENGDGSGVTIERQEDGTVRIGNTGRRGADELDEDGEPTLAPLERPGREPEAQRREPEGQDQPGQVRQQRREPPPAEPRGEPRESPDEPEEPEEGVEIERIDPIDPTREPEPIEPPPADPPPEEPPPASPPPDEPPTLPW